jgi:hypothetical protein
VSIAAENALAGEPDVQQVTIGEAGDLTNLGFCREFSVDVGETAHFSCAGAGVAIDIYRVGWYAGRGWRKVTTVTNTPATQPAPATVSGSNGATTCTDWSTTASWTVPAGTTSGLFVGVFRSSPGPNASYIPFVVRDDAQVADIVYKTSDTTWALAYNYFGTMAAPQAGKNVYGQNTAVGNILDRCHYVSYHRPIITRQTCPQTYWMACEAPLIRFLERNGYNVKYIAGKDLDRDPGILDNGKIFLSSGHDEYWSQPMRDAVEGWRDDSAGRSVFMSANEVFWRIRFDAARDGFWCFKDTMPGPGGHTAGAVLDPVTWTGTFKDTRRPGGPVGEWLLTGTDFRMNGVRDDDAIIVSNPYGGHPVWGGSALVDTNVTLTKVVGFEADSARPTQPSASVKLLAAYTRNINGAYADNNGENYGGNGDLTWGIVSQRYTGGGLTVGFGTCQWSWCLDDTHDRTGGTVSTAGQQFTVNLLRDLGADPVTLMGGLSLRTASSLDVYGLEPAAEPEPPAPPESGLSRPDGTPLQLLLNGVDMRFAAVV